MGRLRKACAIVRTVCGVADKVCDVADGKDEDD